MIILGIETSCDETALALIETRETILSKDGNDGTLEYRIISSLVHSQAALHSAYGGVFPNLAKREHSKNLIPLLKKLLDESGVYESIVTEKSVKTKILADEMFDTKMTELTKLLAEKNSDLLASITNTNIENNPTCKNNADFLKNIPDIDLIAVTEGPGLEPALWVGINFAIILSKLWNIPIKAVNHMEGHIVGSLLQSDKPYGTWQNLKTLPLPAVSLLISGGHTELVKIDHCGSNGGNEPQDTSDENYHYSMLGQTKDDAVGEAFDKVARLLVLPYPGGPHISKLAYEAREKNIASPVKLPRPMIQSGDCNFSFSGLKTAVLYALKKMPHQTTSENTVNDTEIQQDFRTGLAREFEDAVADVLENKLNRAISEHDAKAIIVGGGVSANHLLRERFNKIATSHNIPLFLPDQHVSGDNALMIALVAAMNNTPTRHILRANGTKSLV